MAGWLVQKRAWGWLLAATFVAVNILTHDAVQKVAAWLGERYTVERLSEFVTVGGIVTATVIAVFSARRLSAHPAGRFLGTYTLGTVVLTTIAYNTLFLVNTEAIHFPQYALLGMLVFPLVGRFAESIVWVTLFGALDEAWQYWVLNSEVDFAYFDFNDIALNLLGAALGVLLAATLLADSLEPATRDYGVRDLLRSRAVITAAGILVAGLCLGASGLLSVYPDDRAWIVLMRSGPREAYWETSYWGKSAHVLLPGEGLLLLLGLTGLFLPLDNRIGLKAHYVPRTPPHTMSDAHAGVDRT